MGKKFVGYRKGDYKRKRDDVKIPMVYLYFIGSDAETVGERCVTEMIQPEPLASILRAHGAGLELKDLIGLNLTCVYNRYGYIDNLVVDEK